MTTIPAALPVPLPDSFARNIIEKKKIEDLEFSSLWQITAKVIECLCAGIITALGMTLMIISVVSALPPLILGASLVVGGSLAAAGCWFIFKDCFQESFPLEPAIEKLHELHERLDRIVPPAEKAQRLFIVDEIPQPQQLQPVFEFISKHRHEWSSPVLVSDPALDFEIIGVNKKAYIKLPLIIDLQGGTPTTVGIDSENCELVAINEIRSWKFPASPEDDQTALDRFQTEQIFPETIGKLIACSPQEGRGGVVPILHCVNVKSELGRQQFIVQKLCHGRNLSNAMQMQTLTNAQKRHYATSLFRGVLKMHEKGVLHRNLSPEAILMDTYAYLTDFSYAMLIEPTELDLDVIYNLKEAFDEHRQQIAAPETILENRYDEKSEVYSFGLVLFYLFKGHVPEIQNELERRINSKKTPLIQSQEEFAGLLPWAEEPESPIDSLLFWMMHIDSEQRLEMREAFNMFSQIPQNQYTS